MRPSEIRANQSVLRAKAARRATWRLGVMAALLLAARAWADDGYWTTPGGGSWADTNNWDSGVVADGTDNTAYFGFSFEATIPPNATFTLDGARTIGNLYFTAASGPDNWILGPGTGGALTLDATFNPPDITLTLASLEVTINTVLAGTTGMEEDGAGTLVLTATNTYTGLTLVNGGALVVAGQLGTGGVAVAGGLLGGSGTILGPVLVQSGATLSKGDALTTLTISNSLSLESGSTTIMAVNAATSGQAMVVGLSNVSYGGTLVVTDLAGVPALGQSYPLFSAASASGNFASITPNPGAGLRWGFIPSSGTLWVVSSASRPEITALLAAGTNLVLPVTNGAPGATAYLLAATNAALPRSNWTTLATNNFDVSGNVSFTNVLNPGVSRRFYLVSEPVNP